MNENPWALEGVDPETRRKAVEEAARMGVSLAEYLTDVVVRSALTEQLSAMAAEAPEPAAETDGAFAPRPGSEAFAVRHRIKSLERRLGASVGNLDGAMKALDASMVEIAGRVSEAEAFSSDTANALKGAVQEINANLGAVRLHVANAELNARAVNDANEAAHAALDERCAALDQRIGRVQDIAVTADRTTALLADAHELLKNAVAHDFADFARESAARLAAGLDEVRGAADVAAQEAEAAAAHLVTELRTLRASIEQRLTDSAAETRGRMQAAFADTSERIAALSERIVENERASARAVDTIRAQVADIEDGAQTALEETAETLRQAGAGIAAEVQRNARDTHAAIESVHADLSVEVSELRESQANGQARLKQLDGEISAMRGNTRQAQRDWDQRFDALVARLSSAESNTTLLRTELRTESDRIEECTLAALENQAARLSAADAKHEALLAEVRRAEEAGLAAAQQLAHNMAEDKATLEARQVDTLVRLQTMDAALGRTVKDAELATLRQQVSAISAKLEEPRIDEAARARLDDVLARLTAMETGAGETAAQVHGVARTLERVSAQTAEAAAETEARLHRLEMNVADLDLAQRLPNTTAAEVQERLLAFEARQTQALEALRNDIVRFVADNDGRLAALETPQDDRDLAREFEILRKRIEERVLGVEQRSVRTLEQVVDTVALLEERLAGRDDRAMKSA